MYARTREDRAFLELKSLLQPFGIQHFYTDGWGTYERQIDKEQHTIGKRYTQKTIAEAFELSHSDQTFGTKNHLFFARLS